MKTKEQLETELQGMKRQSAEALGVHQRCEGAAFVLMNLIAEYDDPPEPTPPPPPPPPPTEAERAASMEVEIPRKGGNNKPAA